MSKITFEQTQQLPQRWVDAWETVMRKGGPPVSIFVYDGGSVSQDLTHFCTLLPNVTVSDLYDMSRMCGNNKRAALSLAPLWDCLNAAVSLRQMEHAEPFPDTWITAWEDMGDQITITDPWSIFCRRIGESLETVLHVMVERYTIPYSAKITPGMLMANHLTAAIILREHTRELQASS